MPITRRFSDRECSRRRFPSRARDPARIGIQYALLFDVWRCQFDVWRRQKVECALREGTPGRRRSPKVPAAYRAGIISTVAVLFRYAAVAEWDDVPARPLITHPGP